MKQVNLIKLDEFQSLYQSCPKCGNCPKESQSTWFTITFKKLESLEHDLLCLHCKRCGVRFEVLPLDYKE